MSAETKIDVWAHQLAAATPTLDAEQQRIAQQIYKLIATTGRAVTVGQIADSADASPHRVEESLRSWPLVLWDDDDRVVGFWGIHAERLEPTHSMVVDGTRVYAWCAWDTLFITEILGRPTQVRSTDPHSPMGSPILNRKERWFHSYSLRTDSPTTPSNGSATRSTSSRHPSQPKLGSMAGPDCS
jgi:hypothetical protein